jgi:ribosomal protein S27AE
MNPDKLDPRDGYEESVRYSECPDCGRAPVIVAVGDHRKCAECGWYEILGMRCHECLGDLELAEELGERPFTTCVFECTVCGATERVEPNKVQLP